MLDQVKAKPKKAKKGIRWTCTPLSADRGEVSVLAVVETIGATGLSLFIAWHWNTLAHIAVSATLAPLLLLRTRRSTTLGIKFITYYFDDLYKVKASFIYRLIAMPFVVIIIKIMAVIGGVIRHGLTTFLCISANWRRITLCVDSLYPPELVIGYDRAEKKDPFGASAPTLSSWIDLTYEIFLDENNAFKKRFPERIAAAFFIAIPVYVAFFLSIAYRWSLKSTALIWSPLLWVVISARGSGKAVADLAYIRDWSPYKIMRAYSLFIVVVFVVKMLLFFKLKAAVQAANSLLENRGVYLFVEPHMIPSWQIAAVANGVIAWGLLFFAQWQLMSIQHDSPSRLSDGAVRYILGTTSVVRNLLSFWVIGCTLWIAWKIEWPHFKVQWLPSS